MGPIPIGSKSAASQAMNEVRLCTAYALPKGRRPVIRTGWLRDTPAARVQIEQMIANARRWGVAVHCWLECRT